MLAKIVEWAEEKASLAAAICSVVLAAIWLLILGVKAANKLPILFDWSSPEATLVWTMLGLFLSSLVYHLVKSGLTGDRPWSYFHSWAAPWTFGMACVVLGVFIWARPAPQASYLPLAALLAYTAWATYAFKYGGFAATAVRQRRVSGGSDEPKAEEAPARVTVPTLKFANIYGNEAIKARLKDAAQAITIPRKDSAKPRNGILLHGGPGNGKTVFAEALAGELKLPLVTLAYADIASKWVGEKSTRVRQAFEQAKRKQPCVLFIDEVDSFLESRDGKGDGVKEDRDLVNALLTLMVDIRQARVILIAATNHMDRLDSAGVREGRFDFKVEITPPDEAARIGLLRKGLKDNLPSVRVDDTVIEAVAKRWNGFSVKRILAVTEELPAYLKANGLPSVGFDEFMGALRQLQGQRGQTNEQVKPLEELVFTPRTREMLELVVGRMLDPEHTERHGGTLPTGVLFYGPPGTGKTVACKALASKINWAFLPATGADLARDPKRLEALYAKAKDLRPTIIFIDEADELLKSREFSASTEATNKLLTLMDGVGDRVKDVVWIAATNHPDQIDAALLRGGRFTEKVEFEPPTREALASYLEQWLRKRNIQLGAGLSVRQIAELVGAQSIANAEAIVQGAVNRAVARRTVPVVVSEDDFRLAQQMVWGD